MFDTRNHRSAALGFGLSFLSILPVADGAISIEAAGQGVAAYYFDLVTVVTVPLPDVGQTAVRNDNAQYSIRNDSPVYAIRRG